MSVKIGLSDAANRLQATERGQESGAGLNLRFGRHWCERLGAQKCWAHLLRKAIRLTLLEPDETRYRELLAGLLNVYRTAKRFAGDQRSREVGRLHRIDGLTERLCDVCGDRFANETAPTSEVEQDFFNLVHELVRLLDEDELFTFVRSPAARRTNNATERSVRGAALDRRTGRTSKMR